MSKRVIAVICLLMVFTSCILSGCSQDNKKVTGDKIGIIGAIDVEVDSLKKVANIAKTTKIAEMEFCEGTLGDVDVVIVKCD